MVFEITTENISQIPNEFLEKNNIIHELDINPFGKYMVLMENNTIIGYVYYSDIYERVEINQIEIDSFHRNCGKGTQLLENLIKTVDKNITLEVRKDNIPALKLYKKFGFEEKAIRKGYYKGVDGILMEYIKNK